MTSYRERKCGVHSFYAARSYAVVSAAAVGAVLLTAAAMAQPGPREGRGGRLVDCRADLRDFCRGAPAGKGRRIDCLVDNRDRLSPQCLGTLRSIRSARRKLERAGVSPPPPRPPAGGPHPPPDRPLARVPRNPPSAVSPQSPPPPVPRGGVPTLPAPADSGRASGATGAGGSPPMSCTYDVEAFCQGEARGSATMRCLQDNRDRLSPECTRAIGVRPTGPRSERMPGGPAVRTDRASAPPAMPPRRDAPADGASASGASASGTSSGPPLSLGVACAVEVRTVCQPTNRNKRGLKDCLLANESVISEQCRERLAATPDGRSDWKGGRLDGAEAEDRRRPAAPSMPSPSARGPRGDANDPGGDTRR